MKVKKYTTQPGLLGSTVYYDLNGNKVGIARPRGLLDRIDYYDRNETLRGYSEKAPLGQRVYYDAKGNKIGTSGPGLLESTIYYDNTGNKIGISEIAPFGGSTYYEIK